MNQSKPKLIDHGHVIDVSKVSLTYDPAFKAALECSDALPKAILSPILSRDDFEVGSIRVQETLGPIRGHGVIFDCHITFKDGTECDLEMQKAKGEMPVERMFFYRAMMRVGYALPKGERDFKKTARTIVVILLDGDAFGEGRPLYQISYNNNTTGSDLEPNQGIYVANIRMRDASTELGRLMEDISSCDPGRMHNPVISAALEVIQSNKGVEMMGTYLDKLTDEELNAIKAECVEKGRAEGIAEGIEKGIEKGIAEGVTKGRAETLVSLYRDGDITAEKAAKRLGLSVDEFLALADKKG